MSNSAPPLTVALLTYNRLHYLKEAIQAIIEQSFGDFELLVLDNHSTDGTKEFILDIGDPRIRYVRNAPLSSVEFNCVSAYHIASSRWVIATHDDDIMEPDMLSQQIQLLNNNPNVALVWTQISNIDQIGMLIDSPIAKQSERIFAPGEFITSFLRERLWPMPSGVMFERSLLPKKYLDYYYFRTKSPKANINPKERAGIEDILLPASINVNHAIGFIDSPLLKRRLHLNQFTHTASLSLPGIYLYKELKKIAQHSISMKRQSLHCDAFVARFDIQEAITLNNAEKIKIGCTRKVNSFSDQLMRNKDISPEACIAGLPILVLDRLLSPGKCLNWIHLLNADTHDIASKKLLDWLKISAKDPKNNILNRFKGKKIILFGSAFISALLIIEARKDNTNIVACIDSNINRQNRKLLGIPILAPDTLRSINTDDHEIIITSERDHEKYIEAIIKSNLIHSIKISSWKNLINSEYSAST